VHGTLKKDKVMQKAKAEKAAEKIAAKAGSSHVSGAKPPS
jgi:hypothetical protein